MYTHCTLRSTRMAQLHRKSVLDPWGISNMWIPITQRTCSTALMILAALGGFTSAVAEEPKAAIGEKQITNAIGLKLTLIPSGEFMMGSGESAEETVAFYKKNYGMYNLTTDELEDEHPQHRVRITKSFYLGEYHVTRGQFSQFVKDCGYKTEAETGDKPGAAGWDHEGKRGRESLILTGERSTVRLLACHDVYGLPAAVTHTTCSIGPWHAIAFLRRVAIMGRSKRF